MTESRTSSKNLLIVQDYYTERPLTNWSYIIFFIVGVESSFSVCYAIIIV